MKTTLFSLIVIVSLGLVGCSNTMNGPVEQSSPYAVYNPDAGSIQGEPIGKRDSVGKPPKDTAKKAPPTIFADLLVKLNLTSEQKVVVEKLLAEHKTCVESCVTELKNAERQIIFNAKIQEEAIKTKLKNGEITREQARLELIKLRESVNTELKALPREKVRQCVKSCDETFIASLKQILTPEQTRILEQWLITRGKREIGPKKDTLNPKGRG